MSLIIPICDNYKDFLMDESRYLGTAESISFPKSEDEIREILLELDGINITVQGGKTGITGSGVPEGGHILNLSHFNKAKEWGEVDLEEGFIIVEPGMSLVELKKIIRSVFRNRNVFWPVEPTEESATIGGIIATNAQGICKLQYHSSTKYIDYIKLMDYDGNIRKIEWDQEIELGNKKIKEMETVIGREGITGIITEVRLRLIKKPESIWGITFFFSNIQQVEQFISHLKVKFPREKEASIAAIEYFDQRTIETIESQKPYIAKIKDMPEIPPNITDMVYLEIHGIEHSIEEIAELLIEVAEESGSNTDLSWAVSGEAEIEKMRSYRHAAAETVNIMIENARKNDSRITKLSTDMNIEDSSFGEVVKRYREGLEKEQLNGCIFGHVMENHLHVNILPKTYEEYEKGKKLIYDWAKEIQKNKGNIVVEHGIGKLKKTILGDAISNEYIIFCRELKEKYDSKYRFNRGNII